MKISIFASLFAAVRFGIKSYEAMVEAGATRIGASVGVKIAQEASGVKSTIVAGGY